ncbi:hypothetical protein VSR69_41870 [Paraburkholderia phytofirmans]
MGRKKLTAVRRVALELDWLDPAQPLPEDTVIAGRFGRTPHLPSICVSTLDPFRERIARWFESDVQGTTIHRVLKRNQDYTGSYSAVRLDSVSSTAGWPKQLSLPDSFRTCEKSSSRAPPRPSQSSCNR